MKILVTGANGYIGSKVVKQLLDDGVEVIAADICSNNIDKRAEYINVNIFEPNDNFYEYFGKQDVCLHMAWLDGFIHNSNKHMGELSKHYNFITNLIDNGLKKFVSMGSMHEVGYYVGCIDENTPCNPLSQYGIAKNALRKSIELYAKSHECKFMWLRGYYIFGDDLYGNSIFCKIRQAVREGKDSFPFTSGKNKYDFIHIDDLAKQISACVRQDKVLGIINVCSGKPISLAEQIEWYINYNKLPIKLDYGKYPDRPYDSPCIYGDNKKINRILNMNNRILVTGVKGQLGYDCVRELTERGYTNVKGIDIDDLDLTKELDVKKYINEYKPDLVIHNAAWTQVDKAEQMPDKVYEVNALAPKYIAEACKEVNAKMVYISTDYVFDGLGDKPFEINNPKEGLSIYGKTKAQGEDFITSTIDKYFIVRTSWVFGKNGNNFVKTMLKLADMGKTELNVVCDQVGSVTYTYDLSKLLCDMIETDKYGIYHATNEGYISWAEFAEEIFKQANKNVKVNYVTTEEYLKMVPQQAKRPLNSRMSKDSLDKAGFKRLPDWKDALSRYLKELGE
ncbi:MAG: dTDP-4-dehydrorhamnose reductase [Acholeplasmatales bacterium]|nr:dTDP-4-dehydrorhamnose reductase [Acholeplasmatales bacterium]